MRPFVKIWGESHLKFTIEKIEYLIANHTKEMQELLHRKTDYDSSVQKQEKYERKELLRMISEKAKTNDDLRDLVEYQFNKQLNELIEEFKQPIINEAMMNYTASKEPSFKVEGEKDTE